jgi:glycine hydroxymethyltransferase
VGAILLLDMAHISGLIATQLANDPFEYVDIVTTTTHKTLRGPRGGMIFYKIQYKDKINFGVFPLIQAGPHNNQVAAVAVQMKEVNTEAFREYSRQVLRNAKALGKALQHMGYKIVTGGTDNHFILLDVKILGLIGKKVVNACEVANISVNEASVYGERPPIPDGGVRIGTPAVTTRNMKEEEMVIIAGFIDKVIKVCLVTDDFKDNKELLALAEEVEVIIL